MQLLNSNGNVRFRQLGEATIVSFRVVVAVVRGAKVVREGRGRKNAVSAAAGAGGGERKTGLFGPRRPAWAGELREKSPTYANENDARSTWPPPTPPPLPPLPASSAAVAAAAYRTHCVSHALLSARKHLSSVCPRDFFRCP